MTALAEHVWDALKTVIDPELGINIVDLGLVYDVEIDEAGTQVAIEMTMTTPACPLSAYLRQAVTERVTLYVPAVEEVQVELVWEPRWEPSRMSSAARKALGWPQ